MRNNCLSPNQKPGSGSGRSLKILSLLLAFLFIGFQVFLTNHFSSRGNDLRSLEIQRESLVRVNQELQSEIAALGSLARVRIIAKDDLGLVSSDNRLDYLVPPGLAAR